jgi:guanylate kinase
MGTPIPDPPPGADVLLEIDVQGAEQVLAQRPDATVILLLPPSTEVQAQRLEARGDSPAHIERRVELGRVEVERGAKIAGHTVVNDDLGRAVAELRAIVAGTRSAATCAENPEES